MFIKQLEVKISHHVQATSPNNTILSSVKLDSMLLAVERHLT